jgi:hypothetical protein
LTLYPGKTLVANIGLKEGTHCQDSLEFNNINLVDKPINIQKIPTEINLQALNKIIKFIRTTKPNLVKRLKNKIIKYVK